MELRDPAGDPKRRDRGRFGRSDAAQLRRLEVPESASDYELYLVNPTISEVDGTPVHPSLADLPVVPDLVDVFRRRDHLPSVLADTIAVGAKTLWLQQGLSHDQVARDGEAAGLQVVMDRCLKVDHARLLG